MTTTPADELRAAVTLLRTAPVPGARTMTATTAALLRAREPIAAWLESWTGVDLSEHGPMPEDARHALAVARQILGEQGPKGLNTGTVTPSADRAAILREAADEIAGIDFHPNAVARSLDIAAGLAHRLRRLADETTAEAQQPAAPTVADMQAAPLDDGERQFLTFALDLAANEMASRGDEFTDEDHAALERLRLMAAPAVTEEPGR
ncbi:hypothetical protein ACWC9Q_18385 [Streptomyces sp. NPDC001142]